MATEKERREGALRYTVGRSRQLKYFLVSNSAKINLTAIPYLAAVCGNPLTWFIAIKMGFLA